MRRGPRRGPALGCADSSPAAGANREAGGAGPSRVYVADALYGRGMPRSTPPLDALLVVDAQFLPTLLTLLDHAAERVDLMAFSFAVGSRGGSRRGAPTRSAPQVIFDKLVELRAKGITIRLYIEDVRETAERNRPTAERLAEAGVLVTYGKSHAKGVCIDGRYVLFGSTNLTEQSITKNIETNLLFDDPHVAQGFLRYFDHLVGGGTHGGVQLDLPMIADGAFAEGLVQMIDGAKKTLDFSIYFFDLAPVVAALLRASVRGVHVRGLLHTHATFAMSYVRRTRSTARRLHEGGIADLHLGPPHLFTHSKFLVRDQVELLLGTGNWLVEDVQIHPQLYVRFTNAALAQQLVAHLATTIHTRATPFDG